MRRERAVRQLEARAERSAEAFPYGIADHTNALDGDGLQVSRDPEGIRVFDQRQRVPRAVADPTLEGAHLHVYAGSGRRRARGAAS